MFWSQASRGTGLATTIVGESAPLSNFAERTACRRLLYVQNVYIRRTERKGGKLQTIEFATIPMVKDPNEQPSR